MISVHVRTKRQQQLDYAVKLLKKGAVGKAGAFLLSEGTAPVTQETASKVQEMQFPARASQRASLAAARAHKPSGNVLTTEQALEAIRKAPRLSAAGPLGWRFEHFKATAETAEGQKGAATFVCRVANGEFGICHSSGEDAGIIAGARLIAIANGKKVRPVAIGEVLRRLACSGLIRAKRPEIEAMCLGANNLVFSSDGSAIVKRTVELLLQANSLWLWLRLTSPPHSRELPEKTSFFSFFQNNHGLRDFIPYLYCPFTEETLEKLWRCPPLAGAPGAAGSGQELTAPPRSVPARRVEEDNGTQ